MLFDFVSGLEMNRHGITWHNIWHEDHIVFFFCNFFFPMRYIQGLNRARALFGMHQEIAAGIGGERERQRQRWNEWCAPCWLYQRISSSQYFGMSLPQRNTGQKEKGPREAHISSEENQEPLPLFLVVRNDLSMCLQRTVLFPCLFSLSPSLSLSLSWSRRTKEERAKGRSSAFYDNWSL